MAIDKDLELFFSPVILNLVQDLRQQRPAQSPRSRNVTVIPAAKGILQRSPSDLRKKAGIY
jgi:hypothetical protein